MSAAVVCVGPLWRHSKGRRATSGDRDEQNFRKWRCYSFWREHFELIFSREWSSNVVSLSIGDTITSYSNGKGKCVLIATWKFGKKGCWSVLVSLQVKKITWVRYNFAMLLNWGWLRKFVLNELSLFRFFSKTYISILRVVKLTMTS